MLNALYKYGYNFDDEKITYNKSKICRPNHMSKRVSEFSLCGITSIENMLSLFMHKMAKN